MKINASSRSAFFISHVIAGVTPCLAGVLLVLPGIICTKAAAQTLDVGSTFEVNSTLDPVDAEISAASRKGHGSAGDFDIDLPLTGEPGVECRDGKGDYTVVATFPVNLLSGTATVTAGIGAIAGDPSFSGKTMTINLTAVIDVQRFTLTLSDVTDELGQVYPDTAISMNMLIADATADKTVSQPDKTVVRGQIGQPVTEANFRCDIDANGVIDINDVIAIRTHKRHSLP